MQQNKHGISCKEWKNAPLEDIHKTRQKSRATNFTSKHIFRIWFQYFAWLDTKITERRMQ